MNEIFMTALSPFNVFCTVCDFCEVTHIESFTTELNDGIVTVRFRTFRNRKRNVRRVKYQAEIPLDEFVRMYEKRQ